MNAKLEETKNQVKPVAIIGMGCRYPGGANSPEEFWRLLCEGFDAITEVPASRFDIDAFYDPDPKVPGKTATRYGGFLSDLDQFDALFFGVSPREAEIMDPQQRVLLEVLWEAFEDSGTLPEQYKGSNTGVFIGMSYSDYEDMMFRTPSQINSIYTNTGGFRSVTPGRLSYIFGFEGPSIIVDNACASSLVAVHLACQSLFSGECDLAVAGGVALVLQPQATISFSQAKMLSPQGRCKFGDETANGFVRSEGAGIVLLKTLERAQEDQDQIHAVICGSAVNNDGQNSPDLKTPSANGQERVILDAFSRAGIPPNQIQYIEAHGTGTRKGDSIETEAIGRVLSQKREEKCVVGSVKSNIGHTEAAAGLAGLIKTVLSLKHKQIPPSLHCKNLNPFIPWDDIPITVPQKLQPWPKHSGPAIAGITSLGINGTNSHVVVQEAPSVEDLPASSSSREAHILALSAKSEGALKEMAQVYQKLLQEKRGDSYSLGDLCYSANVKRTHHSLRLPLAGKTEEDLLEEIDLFLQEENRELSPVEEGMEKPKVVFIFPGQGSQWQGMGKELLRTEPVFREFLEECNEAMKEYVEWSLLDELNSDESLLYLKRIDVIQPTLFAVDVALAKLWMSWGVQPDAVIGHSMGEIAASYIAGALSLRDALRIICRRSQLLLRTSGKGAMAMIETSLEEAKEHIKGYEAKLSVAVNNGPKTTVLSGDPTALDEVLETLEKKEIFCRRVKVDVASHSPQMEPLKEDLLQALEGIQPQKSKIPIYSTVIGKISQGEDFYPHYWMNNLREPVLFWPMIQKLLENNHSVFIESSPHPVLLPSVEQGIRQKNYSGVTVPSLRREQVESVEMLQNLGKLYSAGYPVDWKLLYGTGFRFVTPPPYPWQRESFWLKESNVIENSLGQKKSTQAADGVLPHPVLKGFIQPAGQEDTYIWETEISPNDFSFLKDHSISGSPVFSRGGIFGTGLFGSAGGLWKRVSCSSRGFFFKSFVFNRRAIGNNTINFVFPIFSSCVLSAFCFGKNRFLSGFMGLIKPGKPFT